MTRRQHRQWKKQNLKKRQEENFMADDRPIWADDEKLEVENKNWLSRLKEEVNQAIQIRDAVVVC